MKACDKNIQKTLDLAAKMIDLANQGVEEREDNGCAILYGVLLDSGYKIKKLAEKEKKIHIQKGWWQEHTGDDQ